MPVRCYALLPYYGTKSTPSCKRRCAFVTYEIPFRAILLSMESRGVDSSKKTWIITMVMELVNGWRLTVYCLLSIAYHLLCTYCYMPCSMGSLALTLSCLKWEPDEYGTTQLLLSLATIDSSKEWRTVLVSKLSLVNVSEYLHTSPNIGISYEIALCSCHPVAMNEELAIKKYPKILLISQWLASSYRPPQSQFAKR